MTIGAQPEAEPVTHVLFDFDGTLADTLPAIMASYRYAFREVVGLDFPATAEDFVTLRRLRLYELAQYLGGERAGECVEAFRECYLGSPPEPVVLFEGVEELLDALAEQEIGMAIVTNKTRIGLEADLARTRLDAERFVAFVTADDCRRGKPDPAPLLHGCDILGCSPRCALYVGDGPHDIVAADAAGMRSVGAAYGDWGEEALLGAGARSLASRPLDLLPYVLKLPA